MTFIFNSFNKTASKLLLLVPSIIWDQEYNNLDIEGPVEQNSDVLPNPDVIDLEPKLWKKKWSEVKKEDCSASLAKTIKHCDKVSKCFYFDKDWFHLASCLLADCERSFFAMGRLRTWLRSTMKFDCLSSLAIMNIHRSIEVDFIKAAKLFFTLHPRKIQEFSLIFG